MIFMWLMACFVIHVFFSIKKQVSKPKNSLETFSFKSIFCETLENLMELLVLLITTSILKLTLLLRSLEHKLTSQAIIHFLCFSQFKLHTSKCWGDLKNLLMQKSQIKFLLSCIVTINFVLCQLGRCISKKILFSLSCIYIKNTQRSCSGWVNGYVTTSN